MWLQNVAGIAEHRKFTPTRAQFTRKCEWSGVGDIWQSEDVHKHRRTDSPHSPKTGSSEGASIGVAPPMGIVRGQEQREIPSNLGIVLRMAYATG